MSTLILICIISFSIAFAGAAYVFMSDYMDYDDDGNPLFWDDDDEF